MTAIKLSEQQPPKDKWCWVFSNRTEKWFPATWDEIHNVFCNGDCWWDFEKDITHYIVIDEPDFTP